MPLKDPEARREYRRKYAALNSARCAAATKAWREAHPDAKAYSRAANAKHYLKNMITIREKNDRNMARYISAEPGYEARLSRKSYDKDIEASRSKARQRRWNDIDRTRAREADCSHRRRSNFSGKVTRGEWEHVLKIYGAKCLVCKDQKVTRDHVVPVSKGGLNVASNLQPLCRRCNTRKHAKTIDYRPFPYRGAEDW